MNSAEILPDKIRALFWDCDPSSVTMAEYKPFIIGRILGSGDWTDICWLRGEIGDDEIRKWIMHKRGGNLDPRQMRLWELILNLPHDEVSEWVSRAMNTVWGRRNSQ